MAVPKCPECYVEGIEHIVSEDSAQASKGEDNWFEVVCCDSCWHVYGVFAKHVLTHPGSAPPNIFGGGLRF